jgi:hypothetical protein
MILILSYPRDSHVPFIVRKLDRLRAPYLWFDPANFPADAEMRIEYERDGLRRRLLVHQGQQIELDTVKSVWYRRPGRSRVGAQFADAKYHDGLVEHCDVFCAGLWQSLDCLWLPGKPEADRAAENKIVQLQLAARLGFHIPRTLVANSPDSFLDFFEACHGQLIAKPVGQGKGFWLFTDVIRRRMVKGYGMMRHGPVILQEYVPKRLELRITVVGRQVFAAQIDSQAAPHTTVDWRHYGPGYEKTWAKHSLPSDIERLCLEIVEAMGLCFGAIDMIVTPQGEYVFLEINSNGQWLFVEGLTGLPIGDAITAMLLRGAATSAKVPEYASSV